MKIFFKENKFFWYYVIFIKATYLYASIAYRLWHLLPMQKRWVRFPLLALKINEND